MKRILFAAVAVLFFAISVPTQATVNEAASINDEHGSGVKHTGKNEKVSEVRCTNKAPLCRRGCISSLLAATIDVYINNDRVTNILENHPFQHQGSFKAA